MTQSGASHETPSASSLQGEMQQAVGPGTGKPPPSASGGTSAQTSWTQTLTSTAPVPGPPGFYYADVPDRIIAFIIDIILLAIIGSVLALVLGGLLGGLVSSPSLSSAGGELNPGAFLGVSIAQLAVSLGYFGYFWTTSRGTPGMKLLGLQIGHEIDGRSIGWNQAVVRWLILGIPSILSTFTAYASSGLSLIISVVGVAWLLVLLYSMAQSPAKQGLQDRYAHTILVKAGRRAA